MGHLHARTVAALAELGSEFTLARVFDRHRGRAEDLATRYEAESTPDLDTLASEVDVAIVAVPTGAHFEIASQLVEREIDVLVEKPMASTVEEGRSLVLLAARHGRILQVGHVEWYNPAWRRAADEAGPIRRIEVERFQPESPRGLDIDVVQDLMLHDLDWTTRVVGGSVVEVKAGRLCSDGDRLDAVDAELRFEGGSVVVLRCSRCYAKRLRKVVIEGAAGSVTADLEAKVTNGSVEAIASSGIGAGRDPLESQWIDFMEACRTRVQPVNSGAVGVAALELVDRVRDAVALESPWHRFRAASAGLDP